MLGAAAAALLISGHINAVDTFEITVNFYTTDVVEGESHSGYAATTLPFSYVNWYVNGAYETTDYATSDTQTTSYFSHDYAGLGSESGNEVTIKAEGVHRTLSSSPTDEETVTVSSASAGTTSTGTTSTPASIPQAYPTLEVSSDCSDDPLWAFWYWGGPHNMEMKVTPSYVGDAMASFTRSHTWFGSALCYINRYRPGGTVVKRVRVAHNRTALSQVRVDPFLEPTLRPTDCTDKVDEMRKEVTVKVIGPGGWTGGVGGQAYGFGLNVGAGGTPGRHDLEFWKSDPVSVRSQVLRGVGLSDEHYPPLVAATTGYANAVWVSKTGHPGPGHSVVDPAARAEHYSRDETGDNEECSHD